MRIKIYRYCAEPIVLVFTGNASPNGFIDYRIVDAWTKEVMPGNTGWSRV